MVARAAGAEGFGNPGRGGDTVTAGQTLARLTLPEGGIGQVQAPVAGLIEASTATIGAVASGKGGMFTISRAANTIVGLVPVEDIGKLKAGDRADQDPGAGEVDGKRRRIAPTVEPNSQLGQAFIGITTNRRLLVN